MGKYLTAEEIIKKEYGDSKNFITPHVIRRGKIKRQSKKGGPVIAYELSWGEGFDHKPLYGVSVVRYDPATDKTERLTDVSDSFESQKKAEDYIESLKRREWTT